MSQFLNISLSL